MATSTMGDPVDRELTPQPQAPSPSAGDLAESAKQPMIHTVARPPLAPSAPERTAHSTRKRSRSSERRVDDTQPCSSSTESAPAVGNAADGVTNGRQIQTTLTSPIEERPSSANGGSARAATGGEYSTPSQQALEPSPMATTPLIMALTPSSQGREGAMVVSYNDVMLSDSEWEREIAEFGRQLDDMLSRVSDRVLVAQTAQYMRAYPQHTLRFQIKIKQRAMGESQRQSQTKLMLFYLFHEFLKLFQDDELRQIQREWYLTIDEVLHACMRDMKSNTDLKRRVFKTIARWEELGIYSPKIKQWKALASGEVKPRRGAMRLPRTEAERLAEAPDQLQQFPPPPVTKPQDQWNRANYAHLFERTNFRTALDLKQHWRYSAIAFIEALAKNLGISRDIAISACLFFHRVFDRGIYAKERFKFAAACIFLAAKASSKRMKLIRMVKTMHEILESPLLCGDEEILEMERMQLLHYEKLVLKGVDYALSTDLPFFHLETTLQQMPDKFRQDVEAGSLSVLEELFWLPLSLTTPPSFLAEAAAYIGCRNSDRIFSFSWCREGKDGSVLTEKAAKEILKEYRQMREWKKDQEKHFAMLQKTSSSMGGPGPWDMQEVFKEQRGGLRVDVTSMENEAEYTQRGVNESRAVLTTYIDEDSSRGDTQRGTTTSSSRPQSDDMARIKDEPRANGRGDDRSYSRHDHGRDRGNDRYHERDQRNNRDSGRDRRPDRDGERTAVKNESNSTRSMKEEYGSDRRRDYDRDDRGREKDGGKDRSPRRNGGTSRNRDSDRDRKRDSDRGRDESRSRESRDRRDRDRDRDRDRGDRDRKSSRRSRSRSPSPRHSSRSSKRVHRSTSRSRTKSRSRDRSPPRSSRNGDRKRSNRSRDRDRTRSPSSSRDRNRGRDRDRDRDRDRGRDRTRDRDRGRNDTRDRDRQRSDKRATDRTDDRSAVKTNKEATETGNEDIKKETKMEEEVQPEKKSS